MCRSFGFVSGVLACLALAAPALAAPAASLSVTSGPPTTTVTVTGSGFDPSTTVDVFFDGSDSATAASSAAGAVSMPVQVPSAAQPGQHWVTLEQLNNRAAAQASFTVQASWPSAGFTASNRSYNPYENTITPANVRKLLHAWSGPAASTAGSTPVISYKGSEFVADSSGTIRAWSQTGKLLWTDGVGHRLDLVSGVATGTTVMFGDDVGNVYGFKYNCRTDGGVCTPTWITSVGSSIPAGLTVFNGLVYAPSPDGSYHELNPNTGAPVTTTTAFGPPRTPISFSPSGAFWWGVSSGGLMYVDLSRPSGTITGDAGQPAVSPIAVYDDTGYYTDSNGEIRAIGLAVRWVSATSGTNCEPAPAVADNVVYAGGCTSLGAYDAGTGHTLWTVATSGAVSGVSVANGVVYACEFGNFFANEVVAYDASSGGKLWDGGICASAPPTVVNGTVFKYYDGLDASTLTAAGTASTRRHRVRRPDPRRLRVSRRLHPSRKH